MLHLIISIPKENEDDPKVVEARLRQKNWIEKMQKERKILGFYHRKETGGRVAIFRTDFPGDLDKHLEKWKSYVDENFDIYPLKDPKKAEMDMAKRLFGS